MPAAAGCALSNAVASCRGEEGRDVGAYSAPAPLSSGALAAGSGAGAGASVDMVSLLVALLMRFRRSNGSNRYTTACRKRKCARCMPPSSLAIDPAAAAAQL